jgi:hypothetical protein
VAEQYDLSVRMWKYDFPGTATNVIDKQSGHTSSPKNMIIAKLSRFRINAFYRTQTSARDALRLANTQEQRQLLLRRHGNTVALTVDIAQPNSRARYMPQHLSPRRTAPHRAHWGPVYGSRYCWRYHSQLINVRAQMQHTPNLTSISDALESYKPKPSRQQNTRRTPSKGLSWN